MSFVARGRVDCKDSREIPDFAGVDLDGTASRSNFSFRMVLGATKLVGLTKGTMSTQRRGYSGSAWGDPKTKLAWEIQPGRRLCWRRRGGVLMKWFLGKTGVFHPPNSKT